MIINCIVTILACSIIMLLYLIMRMCIYEVSKNYVNVRGLSDDTIRIIKTFVDVKRSEEDVKTK